MKNPAPLFFSYYAPLTVYAIWRKSLEPFLRTFGDTHTDGRTDTLTFSGCSSTVTSLEGTGSTLVDEGPDRHNMNKLMCNHTPPHENIRKRLLCFPVLRDPFWPPFDPISRGRKIACTCTLADICRITKSSFSRRWNQIDRIVFEKTMKNPFLSHFHPVWPSISGTKNDLDL